MSYYKWEDGDYYAISSNKNEYDDDFKNTPTDRWKGSEFISRSN